MRHVVFAVALLIVCGATSVQAQKTKRCSGSEPDSAWMLLSPVYRDCEVDKPAKLKGNPPLLNYRPTPSGVPRDQCWAAAFEFVVDSTGLIEPATVRAMPGNDADLQAAVAASFDNMKWQPAKKDGQPVRQLYAFRITSGVTVRAVQLSGGGSGAVPVPHGPPPRPPKC